MAFCTGFKGVFTGVGGPSMIEKDHLYSKHPEIVCELKSLLEQSRKSGRSARYTGTHHEL
jgi:hypothetical protein